MYLLEREGSCDEKENDKEEIDNLYLLRTLF